MATEDSTPATATAEPAPAAHLTFYQWQDANLRPFELSRSVDGKRDGQPVHRYWKEMARPGEITDSKGVRQSVTMSRLKTIHDGTKSLMAKGYEPYLPLGMHPKNIAAGKAASVGYITDLRMEADGSLHGLHEFIGFSDDEVKKLVARQKSSLGTIADLTDVDGVTYAEVLDHNAIIPDPQFNDLGPFVPADVTTFEPALAASRGLPVEAVTLRFDRGSSQTGGPMAQQLTGDHVAKIKKMVGDHEGVETSNAINDDNAIDSVLAHVERMHAKPAWRMSREELDAAKALTGMEALTVADAGPAVLKLAKETAAQKLQLSRDLKEAEKVAAAEKARALELSRDNKAPAPPTAREMSYAAAMVNMAKDRAIATGAITPFVAEQAEARFLKRPVDFKTLTLSREVQAADGGLLVAMDNLVTFYEAVQGNTPSPVQDRGEAVGGGSVMELGRAMAPGTDPAKQKAIEAQWEAEEAKAKEQRMAHLATA